MSKIPVTIVTGYLGSGKTTLINRALRDARLKRTAVIVNEFGAIPLDHDLIEASRDSIFLLQNGCLCCSVRGSLVETLVALHQKRLSQAISEFDRVIIETSGLAEPTPVNEVLLAEPRIKSCYSLAGIITAVDAVNGQNTLQVHVQAKKQAILADRIVLTKSDLLGQPNGLERILSQLNPTAEILDAAAADPAELINELSCSAQTPERTVAQIDLACFEAAKHGHNHNQNIYSFSLVRAEPWPFDTLKILIEVLIANLGPTLLRVKGIVNISERPGTPAVINGAQQLLHSISWLDNWPTADHRTRIIFITSESNAKEVKSLISDIERFCDRTQKLQDRHRTSASLPHRGIYSQTSLQNGIAEPDHAKTADSTIPVRSSKEYKCQAKGR